MVTSFFLAPSSAITGTFPSVAFLALCSHTLGGSQSCWVAAAVGELLIRERLTGSLKTQRGEQKGGLREPFEGKEPAVNRMTYYSEGSGCCARGAKEVPSPASARNSRTSGFGLLSCLFVCSLKIGFWTGRAGWEASWGANPAAKFSMLRNLLTVRFQGKGFTRTVVIFLILQALHAQTLSPVPRMEGFCIASLQKR